MPVERSSDAVPRRAVVAGPAVAAATLAAALVATHAVGMTFRDPDHVAAGYVVEVGAGVALLVGVDIVIRAWRRSGRQPTRGALRAVRRERWTGERVLAVATALVGFYITYLAYRNLKAAVPLLRPDVLFDGQLARIDRALLAGHDPAVLLHRALGTGVATQALSTVYVAFIVFLPLTLGLYLVFAPRLRDSLLYSTALSLNWLLGIASYLALPSLGPIYSDPATFAGLPHSEVTHLQHLLLEQRIGFLAHPETGTPQAIAAFASLHVSMSTTALLAASLLGVRRRVRALLWAWLAVTLVATVYLGWHFVVDDLAGLAMGAVALPAAAVLTGFDARAALARRRVTAAGRGLERRGGVAGEAPGSLSST